MLQVLQMDFWKGKLQESLHGASCSAGQQHRWVPTLGLACWRDRPLSGAALCWFLQSEKLLQQIWLLHGVKDTDCTVGREAGWQLDPCPCPWAAVDCEPLFHCANVLFSLHGSDLGTSDVPVTGWGSFALKTLQSAHHNVHVLWQLVYILLLLKCLWATFPVPGSHWLFSPFTKG